MFAIIFMMIVGVSLASGDPVKETCTVTTGQLGETIETCRRVGVIEEDGGQSKTYVDTTNTHITGPHNIDLSVPGSVHIKDGFTFTSGTPNGGIGAAVQDRVYDKINKIKNKLNIKPDDSEIDIKPDIPIEVKKPVSNGVKGFTYNGYVAWCSIVTIITTYVLL
ncbi:uncharacterized protein LOC142981606 [Anticarsia gemmatalis]|uniref:uncharacterized protein LOC142981606 n=1 Tax=Anticarsia gemmatalis TaxID=129554 RepID=UPI003F7628F8